MTPYDTIKQTASQLEVNQINTLIKYLSATKKEVKSQRFQRKIAMKQIQHAFAEGYQF